MSVPDREGGDDREWGVPNGVCPGDDGGTCPGGYASPYGDGVLGGVGERLTGEG